MTFQHFEQLNQTLVAERARTGLHQQAGQNRRMDQSPHRRKALVAQKPLEYLQQAARNSPRSTLTRLDRRWLNGSFGQLAFTSQLPSEVEMLADGPPFVSGCGRTGPPNRHKRGIVARHDLQRKHPANERLGLESQFFVQPAHAVRKQEYAASVLAVGQPMRRRHPAFAHDDGYASKFRPLFPLLRLDPSQFLMRQRHEAAAAASTALMAVPAFDDRQGLDRQRHPVILDELLWPANRRFDMVRGLMGVGRSGSCCALCDRSLRPLWSASPRACLRRAP